MKAIIAAVLFGASVAVASAAAPMYFDLSVGYLTDSEEAMYSAHYGFEVARAEKQSHNLELEIGYTSDKEDGLKGEIVPFMANYRFVTPVSGSTEFFLGAGLGVSRVKISGFGLSESDSPFTWQGFAGVNFKLAEKVSLSLAARYMKINDAEFFGEDVDIGHDTEVRGGISFRF